MWDDARSYIGMRDTWGGQELLGISPDARTQHFFLIGQTGTGKPLTSDGYAIPFRAITMRPLMLRTGRRRIIIARSRERFATKRTIVESRIERWLGQTPISMHFHNQPVAREEKKPIGCSSKRFLLRKDSKSR